MITAIALLIAHSVVAKTPTHKFYSGPVTRATLVAEASSWAVDMAYTCHNLSPRGHEDWLPASNCGQAIALTAGFHVAGEGLAYLLHRTGHHKLEQLPRWYLTASSVRAAAYSSRQGWR